jgi:hypothetical protein
MYRTGFKLTIPVSERAKAFCALDRAGTVIGRHFVHNLNRTVTWMNCFMIKICSEAYVHASSPKCRTKPYIKIANNSLECIYSNVFFYGTRLTNKTYTHEEVKGTLYATNAFYHPIQNHLPFSLLYRYTII